MRFRVELSSMLEVNRYKLYWAFVVLLSTCYLIVAVQTPLSILAWQSYDDMLFINHAQSIAEGRWLGSFSELTLVKGPGYPFFLALNYWLGLPITFTHSLFYCISLIALSLLVSNISKSYLLAALLFTICLWDPRVFELNRIMRDAIYSGQSILVVTFFSYALFAVYQGKNQVLLSVLSGVMLGWFWLTREEGIWLIPGLAFIFVFAFLRNKYQANSINTVKPILISIFFFVLTQIIFSLGNLIAYGEFIGVDMKEKNFQSAIKSMESVRSGDRIPYVSVPRNVRTQIYKISPTFAELKKFIDPDNATSPWEAGGCLFRPTACGDIGNGFFFWAVREAAGKAGYYATPAKAAKFYELINADIQYACKDNRLKCEASYIPYMPPITYQQFTSIPTVLVSILDSIFSAGTLYSSTPWKIWGPEFTFNRALSVLNYPVHYPMVGLLHEVEFAGWYHHKNKGNAWFSVAVSDDYSQNLAFDLARNESPDLAISFADKDAIHQRFRIKTRCSEGCKLIFSSLGGTRGTEFVVPVKNAKKYMAVGDVTLAFDSINTQYNYSDTTNIRVMFSLKARMLFHQIYKVLLPVLLIVGFLSFILSCYLAIKKTDYPILLAIAGAFWISLTSRAVILVLVDISSFPAIIVPYMQPIFAFSIIASILSIGVLFAFFRNGYKNILISIND